MTGPEGSEITDEQRHSGAFVGPDRPLGAGLDFGIRTDNRTPASAFERLRSVTRDIPPATWLLAAIVITLPLEASKLLFPIQQLEIARLLMLPAVAWLALALMRGARPFPRGLALAIAATVGVILISFLATGWSDGALIVAAPVVYIAFSAFVATAIRSERQLRLIGLALALSGGVVAVIAIVQVITGWYLWRPGELSVLSRANATFADPNITARMLGIVVIVLVAGLAARVNGANTRGQTANIVAIAIVSAGLVMTGSRWGWAAFAVVLVVWLFFERRNRRAYLGAAVVVCAFALTAVINPAAALRARDIVSGVVGAVGGVGDGPSGNLDPNQPTTYSPPRDVIGHDILRRLPIDGVRLYLLEAGVAMWEDHPLAGVGTGGFRPTLAGEYQAFIPTDRRSAPVLLHHSFLGQLAAENGWLGIVALTMLLGSIAFTVRRVMVFGSKFLRAAALATGAAILLVFLTSQAEGRFLSEPYLWLAVGVLASLHVVALKNPVAPGAPLASDLA